MSRQVMVKKTKNNNKKNNGLLWLQCPLLGLQERKQHIEKRSWTTVALTYFDL
jgi:hypothetical protein